jgi:hypothetical protein
MIVAIANMGITFDDFRSLFIILSFGPTLRSVSGMVEPRQNYVNCIPARHLAQNPHLAH